MASPTQWTSFQQAPGAGDGQGSLASCSPWGRRESDTTERTNSNSGHPSRVLTFGSGECSSFQLNTTDPRQRHGEPVSDQGRGFLPFSFLGEGTRWLPLFLGPGVEPSSGAPWAWSSLYGKVLTTDSISSMQVQLLRCCFFSSKL